MRRVKDLTNAVGMLVNGLVIFLDGIPFIHRNDHAFTLLMGNSGDLGILLGNALGSVNHHNHKVCPLYCGYGTDHAEALNLFLHLSLAAKSCSVDKNIFLAVPGNLGINRIREVLSFMPYAEIVFISAKTGLRISRMFETLDAVIENQTMRIQTGVLNEILAEAVAMQQPPSDKGKRLKIFYMTQVAVKPPTFVIFVNDKELMHFSYTRYLENKIRDAFDFGGTPLRFIVRERGEKE